MYQVLLADDEQSILDSMRDHIPWAQLDLNVANCALTGKQAYEILIREVPDIAILDIRMPGCSGLELSRLIQQEHLKTKVIIISGYAEFSYAQKAIQYGVVGYCLKPVEYEEVSALLLKAVHLLKQDSNLATKDDFLEALERNDLENLQRYLDENHFSAEQYYLAAAFSDSPLRLPGALSFRVGPSLYCYLAQTAFDMQQLQEASQVTSAGVYPQAVALEQLRRGFYRCLAMAYQYFCIPGCKICNWYREFQSLPLVPQLLNAISFGEKNRLELLLNQLLQDKLYEQFSVHAAQKLYNMIISNQKLVPNSQDYYIYSYRQLVHEYSSFQDMAQFLLTLLHSSEEEEPEEEGLSNTYFLKIVKYINTYYNENITLTDVAKVVNLNPNYISQVFKKSAGTTFSHYLTNLRINQARKLLTTTSQSINEISLQSGFNDYFYFLKAFKKATGKTPSEYRDSAYRQQDPVCPPPL